MSGHSKWSSIKHQKGIADARRGQLFTKLTREIIVAVRQGGGSVDANFRLRLAIQKARENSMPSDNIDRAIKKGSGTLEGSSLSELTLEGYGPSGVAILVQALTDNRNRTIQEVRSTFSRNGNSLGESGCVAWLFVLRGLITVETEGWDKDELEMQAIEAGADDFKTEEGYVEIQTKPEDLEAVRLALSEKKIPIASAELSMIPKTTVELDEKVALQTLRLIDKLEELDDVQHVFSNVDFSDEILEKHSVSV